MARVCDRCGRGSLRSFSRSHSNIATIKRQHLNLQKARIDGRSMRVCTSCIRSFAHAQALLSRAQATHQRAATN